MRKPGPGLLPQADELPDALPDLPVARALLSRTSVAALRVRHGLPLRAVRRGARADPGARADHGRRAHLLHPRADARRADVAAAVRARSARRLRPDRLLPGAVHQGPGQVRRLRRDVGGGHQHAGRGRRGVRAGPGARPGRRGVLRPEDLRSGQGRAGPQLADVDDPAGLQLPRAVRAGVHRRRRQQAAAGDDPPRAVRVDRAVLRHPHRALRGRVPGVAGAGAGGRHPGRRRPRRRIWKALPRN